MRGVVIVLGVLVGCYDPTIPTGLACADGDPPCPADQLCDPGQQLCVDELPPADASTPDTPSDSQVDGPPCPPGYTMLAMSEPHLYKVVAAVEPWPGAQAKCESDGTYLAIPDTLEESMLLAGSNDRTWIGISDLATEGTFVTVLDGVPPYLGWAPGEPDNDTALSPDGQDCAKVYGPNGPPGAGMGTLDDDDCSVARYRFLCECDP